MAGLVETAIQKFGDQKILLKGLGFLHEPSSRNKLELGSIYDMI